MSPRHPESERPSAVPAVLAATALVVVLATWAAVIGPDRVFGSDPLPRETSSEQADDPEFSQSDPGEEDEEDEEIVRDADQQLALLREGSPRNGIVACWHRFEVQAEAVGIGREPWETSAEFTLRVLDLVSADEHAVAELAVLYREARFSDHDLGEPVRSSAVDALERIHRGLGARYAGGPS